MTASSHVWVTTPVGLTFPLHPEVAVALGHTSGKCLCEAELWEAVAANEQYSLGLCEAEANRTG